MIRRPCHCERVRESIKIDTAARSGPLVECAMHTVPLIFAVFVMGATFVIAQVVALREFLVVFQGNELHLGIVLGNWLLLEALGSWGAGRPAERSAAPSALLADLQLLVSIVLPATLLGMRMSRELVAAAPWETVGPLRVWIGSLLVLAPLALLLGAQFTFLCRLFSQGNPSEGRAAGIVYCLEAVGSVCGGILFTFVLAGRVQSAHTVLVLVILNAVSAALLSAGAGGVPNPGAPRGSTVRHSVSRGTGIGPAARTTLCLIVLSAATLLWASGWAGALEHLTAKLRWRGLDLLESADSVYGNVSVFKTGEQLSFFHNGVPAITSPIPDIASAEEFVHVSLLSHRSPKTVLSIGGGLGGPMTEMLKHPLEELFYVELDPLVVRMVRKFPSGMTGKELEDPRVHIRYEDGRRFLSRSGGAFDVILVNLAAPSTLFLNRAFTLEFFAAARRHLRPEGLLCLAVPGSSTYLGNELLLLSKSVLTTLRHAFGHVRYVPGERGIFIASSDVAVEALSPEVLAGRMRERGIQAAAMSPRYIDLKLDPRRVRWFEEALGSVGQAKTNQDLSPSLVSYVVAYQTAQLHPRGREAFAWLERLRGTHVLAALFLLNIPLLLRAVKGRTPRITALSFSIFTTGCSGMTAETIVIFCFQSVYGYVYQWVGILVSSFMVGLALGAMLVTGGGWGPGWQKGGYRLLLFFEAFLFVLIVAAAAVLSSPALSARHVDELATSGYLKVLFVALPALAGVIVGAEFPLANRESLRASAAAAPTRVAGRLYGIDLAGACLGAFVVSAFLVPLLGIPWTLLIVGAMKAYALFYLAVARKGAGPARR